MHILWNDLRYALRRLSASPGFTAAALVTLALGTGANTAIFTLVNAVMLRPLPVTAPEELVEVYTTSSAGTPATSSYPDYRDYRDQATGLRGQVTAFSPTLLTRSEQGRSEILFGEGVSGNFFQVMGISPSIGRAIGPEDDQPGRDPVTVVGHGYWQRRLGADPSIVGRTLTISGQPVTVIGVMPSQYTGSIVGLEADLWVPIHTDFALTPSGAQVEERGSRSLFLRARLAEGQTIAQAQAELDVVSRRLATDTPPPTSTAQSSSCRQTTSACTRRWTRCSRRSPPCSWWCPDSSCSSPARTWPTCCSRAHQDARGRWPFACPSAPAAVVSCNSC